MIETRLDIATAKQRAAADPAVSAWVRANAGTGKTHMLVQRILRLLLSGAEPRSILCLTFTKNAAAEMEARVLSELGRWATATEVELDDKLTDILDRVPSREETMLARCLFASVIDAPGGLAMMTTHSFCERVLRRFSLEAGVPPGFSVMSEEEVREALAHATALALAAGPKGFETLVGYADETGFAKILKTMIGKRAALIALFRFSADDPAAHSEMRLRKVFDLQAWDNDEKVRAAASGLLDPHLLKLAVAALSQGKASDLDAAARFQGVLDARGVDNRFAATKTALFTKEGKPRTSLATKDVRKTASDVFERLSNIQAAFADMDAKICAIRVVEATSALLRLTAAILDHYESEKQSRSALDFDDLIGKTLALFSRANAAEWVLYQLDQRIDHVLVDEAQDTAPSQWAILERLTADFFAGQSARDVMPTIFCVGDEKQSIYGFQGAAPELLTANGTAYEDQVRAAKLPWRSIDLDLSFRTLAPILSAVDLVAPSLPGLMDGAYVPHLANREEQGGVVELWEPETAEKPPQASVYDVEDAAAAPNPDEMLADRIGAQIAHWLMAGQALASTGKAIQPSDVLILLRKREPMATLLQSALKRAGVPVAGSDRFALLDSIAVSDLLALADALLQPNDDLALAAVLKSPLLGMSEDSLYHVAYDRAGSLWNEVCSADQDIAQKLRRWRALSWEATPFNFFSAILEGDGACDAFAARLGPQCHDALDELLTQAEAFETGGGSYLTEFVSFLRQSGSEVKREAAQVAQEVRVMTVHGAKGLEAPIVILADTCRALAADKSPVLFIEPDDLPVWAVKEAASLAQIEAAKAARKTAQEREDGRLLYVALTRARDRLYIAGSHSRTEAPKACWYDTLRQALAPQLTETVTFDGRKSWRFGEHVLTKSAARPDTARQAAAFPAFTGQLPALEPPTRILSPSRLAGFEGGGKAGHEARSVPRETAQVRGTLIHHLLEILPKFQPEHRSTLARLIFSSAISDLPASEREKAIESALAIISKSEHAKLFERDGLSEAGLALKFGLGGHNVLIMGQADRVLISGADITVVDYKSGASTKSGAMQDAHAAQLSAYGLALNRIFSGCNVKALLLQTTANEIQHLDSDFETCLMAALRKYQVSNLDAPPAPHLL